MAYKNTEQIEILQIVIRGKKEQIDRAYKKLNKFLDTLENENDRIKIMVIDMGKEELLKGGND